MLACLLHIEKSNDSKMTKLNSKKGKKIYVSEEKK